MRAPGIAASAPNRPKFATRLHVDQLLAELNALAPITEWDRKLRQARAELDQAVAAARRDGQSWEAIGQALGVTRQGAWDRYRYLEPR